MDILKDVTHDKFLLILLNEAGYEKKLLEIIEQVERNKSNICYVCISTPYTYVINALKKKGSDTSRFFFIDVLSSHYRKPKDTEKCIFVSGPNALDEIKNSITKTIKEKNCSILMFDTITSLLIYQESYSIVKFTHEIICDREEEDTKKLFIVLKDKNVIKGENLELAKDIGMFADKTIEL